MNQSKEMAKLAYAALSDKKGEDIQIIDISGVSVLADYFLMRKNCIKQDILWYREKEMHPEDGCYLILVILLYTSLIVRTDSSTIWRESGKMDIMCLLKILKHK